MRLLPFVLALSGCLLSPALAHPGHDGPHEPDPTAQLPLVVAVEYSDFQCAPCAEVATELKKLTKVGRFRLEVIFKHAPTHAGAITLHEAAIAAGKQGKFWEMHDLLFAKRGPTYADLIDMARSLKLDLKKFQQVLDEREARHQVLRDITESKGLGVNITPTVFLNGRKLEGIDQIRAFVTAVVDPPQPRENSDSKRVYTFNLKGSPAMGPAEAPITIVEFSDFRCGFCGVHSRNVSQLVAANPGKIRRVFKHFPIQVTAEGRLPHHASMAAGKQGKFWEMYHALMAKPVSGPEDVLACAKKLGLDLKRFQADLNTRAVQDLISRDIREGDDAGIRSTPTTFINGRMVSGRQTLATLQARVDALSKPSGAIGATSVPPNSNPANQPHGSSADEVELFANLADPNCPDIFNNIARLRTERSELKVRFRHYPPANNPAALLLHRAVAAAEQQGKLWELCSEILASSRKVDRKQLQTFALQLGLDADRFERDLRNNELVQRIATDADLANRKKLAGKSTVFIKGKPLNGIPTLKQLSLESAECCRKAAPSN